MSATAQMRDRGGERERERNVGNENGDVCGGEDR